MKVLVAAKAIDPDTTSEGICTSKFISTLGRLGHDVVCLTGDKSFESALDWQHPAWLAPARVKHVRAFRGPGPWPGVRRSVAALRAAGRVGSYGARKLDAAVVYGTGFRSETWSEVTQWHAGLQTLIDEDGPDVVFVRSAGGEMMPHLGMLRCRTTAPWVANYHDPFPISLYPEPYRSRTPIVSDRQESLHGEILAGATALTFPSRRLLHWVLDGRHSAHREKAFVIPHLGNELPAPRSAAPLPAALVLPPDGFNLVHAGTLLGPRDPLPLVSAFRQFASGDAERQQRARLVFVGPVNRAHAGLTTLSGSDARNVVVDAQRVSYQQSLDLVRSATAAVVVEAASTESPFFPAKLADYLWLRKPMLALSPRESVVADLLGPGYPLLAAPRDVPGIVAALELLWQAWRDGALKMFEPDAAVCARVHDSALRNELDQLFSKIAMAPA